MGQRLFVCLWVCRCMLSVVCGSVSFLAFLQEDFKRQLDQFVFEVENDSVLSVVSAMLWCAGYS